LIATSAENFRLSIDSLYFWQRECDRVAPFFSVFIIAFYGVSNLSQQGEI
jgi:hypothetical protein